MPEFDPEQLRRVFDLVFDAPDSEREAILDRECAGDAHLRHRVEVMLAGAADDRFLVEPTISNSIGGEGSSEFGTNPPGEQPGERIGPYKLLHKIGEGGFGAVFLAEQEQPVRRRVALKIIKLGMDTRQVVARFEQERQALALMDHPNIAKVFDAGATTAGRPYFVMELCAGESITEYCDKHNLSISDRLRLFVQVCQAVQHAHQKGLIHRDIKPSNVLVSTQDGRPHAKVIDFGIAKATASKLTEKTLFTEHKQLIGTPEYMSPEQAEGSLDIDTRTDVYSLGVLLYKLLTGDTPFDSKSLRSAAYAEIQRIIREVDPPKPSTRLRQSSDTIASVASCRNIEPKKLGTIVRGELDWIVMKALEKDRQRRYESPNALGIDIQRYLSGEAVFAAPPSRSYLLRKFARRNKGPVSAVAAVGIALLAGIVAFAWQAKVSRNERDRAIKAEAQTAERARELQKVSDFQFQMLSQVDPSAAGLRLTTDVRARFEAALAKAGVPEPERAAQAAAFAAAWSRVNATDTAQELIKSTILAPALEAIDRQFHDEPKLDAQLRSAISSRYIDLGLYDDSLAVFDQLREVRQRAFGADNAETVNAIVAKCKVLTLLGRASESESVLRPLIDKQRGKLGADNAVLLRAIEFLGEALTARHQYSEAEKLFRDSLAGHRRVLGDDHEDTLMSMGNLSMALRGQAKYAEAEAITRELLERRQRIYGENHNYTLSSYNNLGTIVLDEGRFQEAADLFRKAADGRRQLLGEAHRETIVTTNNLAAALGRLHKYAEEESIQRELLDRTRRVLGPDHPDSLMILSNLVSTLIELGKLDEAEPLCRESLERRLRVFGPNSAGAVTGNNIMAFLLRRQKKDAEAEPYLRAALDASRTAWGEDHPERMVLLLNMGSLARECGRPAESEQLYREAVERCTRNLGAEHPYKLMAVQGLSETLFAENKYAECVQLLSNAEPSFRQAAAKIDQGDLRALLLGLGKAQAALHEFAAAEANLKEAHAQYLAARGAEARGTQRCVQALVDLYDAWNVAEPDGKHETDAAEWRARLTPASSRPTTTPTSAPK
jgi:eukaryotic-like serine/threonine-protein kinase